MMELMITMIIMIINSIFIMIHIMGGYGRINLVKNKQDGSTKTLFSCHRHFQNLIVGVCEEDLSSQAIILMLIKMVVVVVVTTRW